MSDIWNNTDFERLMASDELSFTNVLNDDSTNGFDLVEWDSLYPPSSELPNMGMSDDSFNLLPNGTLVDLQPDVTGPALADPPWPFVGNASDVQAAGADDILLVR
jgi:hypothetical protein